MIEILIKAILKRAFIVFLIVHIGLGLCIYGLAALSYELNHLSNTFYILLSGVATIYGGLLISVFFIISPIYSIVRKIQKLLKWRDWILTELPKIIALIPAFIQAVKKGFNDSPTNTNSES